MNRRLFSLQYLLAAALEWEHHELDMREDECLRMFGITVLYIMDERIIECAP